MQLSNNCVNMAFPPRRASAVISNMHFPMKGGGRGSWPRRSETRATLASPLLLDPRPRGLATVVGRREPLCLLLPLQSHPESYAHPFQGAYTHMSVHAYICVWQGERTVWAGNIIVMRVQLHVRVRSSSVYACSGSKK